MFTNRQQKFLDCLLDGMKNEEINAQMGGKWDIPRQTVKGYVSTISRKMGIEKGKYHSKIRVLYLEAQQRGLLKNWPKEDREKTNIYTLL